MPRYEELRREVEALGLLTERRYAYYFLYATLVILGVVISLYLITSTTSPYIQISNALFLGFLFVQAGMLGHDLSHRQVFCSERFNRFFSMFAWGLFGGLSESKWYEKHNAHHRHPNHVNRDPDLAMPFIFSDVQIAGTSQIVTRYVVPFQHVIFFALLPLQYMSMIAQTQFFIFYRFSLRSFSELLLILIHFLVLFLFVFFYLPFSLAVAYLLIHTAFCGIYMSLVFAPNHKGEAVIGENEIPPWTTQITSTRNVIPSPLIFHIFGGLNFQIEHHLFPSMARPNYLKIQPVVKRFCIVNNLQYHETSWLGSLKEIYFSLKREADAQRARVRSLAPRA